MLEFLYQETTPIGGARPTVMQRLNQRVGGPELTIDFIRIFTKRVGSQDVVTFIRYLVRATVEVMASLDPAIVLAVSPVTAAAAALPYDTGLMEPIKPKLSVNTTERIALMRVLGGVRCSYCMS